MIRQKGLLNSLKKHCSSVSASQIRICTPETFFEEMGKLLQMGIDGVFCGGGGNFGGIAAYCLSLYGKKIPDEIRLISSERHRISRYCIPAQTTITQDYQKLASETIALLEQMIHGDKVPLEIVLPYSLIARDST
jgi:LacI family transcriptional regulator